MQFQFLGQEDLLKEGMATHYSNLAWKIPWTEKPGGLRITKNQTRLKQFSMHTHINKLIYKTETDSQILKTSLLLLLLSLQLPKGKWAEGQG